MDATPTRLDVAAEVLAAPAHDAPERHPADPGAFVPGPAVHRAGAADGPLVGLTFAAKDLFDLAGLVTGAGNPDWARTHEPAGEDAPAVAGLLAAGATLGGRTITDELAFSLVGRNVHFGTPRNGAAADRIPGGSSSGSASAVAHGLVDVALGTDTGGSIRVPATCNGLYGVRPTHGRVSLAGTFALARSFDTCGWFARDPATLERVGEVLLGPDPPGRVPAPVAGVPELLIARDLFEAADPDVADALEPVLATLRIHARVHEVEALGAELLDGGGEAFRVLQGREMWAEHGVWIEAVHPRFGPDIARRVEMLPTLTADDEARAKVQRAAITARLEGLTAGGVALVLPTMPTVAPSLTATNDDLVNYRARTMRFTALASLAGLPQVAVPAARTRDGIPVGISLLGARGDDRHLLRLARLITPSTPVTP